jgi:hypothetical protein
MVDNSAYFNKLNRERLEVRLVDELIGLAKGVTADGQLLDSELEYLVRWLVANREIASDPLVGNLYRQIQVMLSDGVLDDDERTELFDTLQNFGSKPMETGEPMLSTAIPFVDPMPPLGFAGWRYCFTGTFLFGHRDICEAAVVERGGQAGSLTKATDALVVGYYATESWLHSPYGRKIMKATEMQQSGHHIIIVPEQHWTEHLVTDGAAR